VIHTDEAIQAHFSVEPSLRNYGVVTSVIRVFEAVSRPREGERGSVGVDEAWRAVGGVENEAETAAKCQKRVTQTLLAARNEHTRPKTWGKFESQAGDDEPRE
jgi:hypothetical protein